MTEQRERSASLRADDGEERHPDRAGLDRAAPDRAGLDRLLAVGEMAWFVARVRRRILASRGAPLRGVVQLNEPSAEQRAAAVRLVGRPKRAGTSLRVDLAVAEEVLRRGPWPAGLADAIETISGPVTDHRAQQERQATAWDAARDELTPSLARFPGVDQWWQRWCGAGGLKRAAGAEAARTAVASSPAVGVTLTRQVAEVLQMLPAAEQPLAILAREAVGDAHGLDASRPLGRLAATVVRAAFLPAAADEEQSTRDIWAGAGVVLSNVASTALCLGVPGLIGASTEVAGHGAQAATTAALHGAQAATAAALEAMRAARVPMVLTLDQVRSGGVGVLPPHSVVHVCENPTVVEVVADHWARARLHADGSDGVRPVLVCTSGQPSAAVVELLRRLCADGAEMRYHGDFDWAGLRIAQTLSRHLAWEPWRYRDGDYRAAVEEGKPSRALTGSPAESPWDPDLANVMADSGFAVEEEAVAHLLARDVLREPSSE